MLMLFDYKSFIKNEEALSLVLQAIQCLEKYERDGGTDGMEPHIKYFVTTWLTKVETQSDVNTLNKMLYDLKNKTRIQ